MFWQPQGLKHFNLITAIFESGKCLYTYVPSRPWHKSQTSLQELPRTPTVTTLPGLASKLGCFVRNNVIFCLFNGSYLWGWYRNFVSLNLGCSLLDGAKNFSEKMNQSFLRVKIGFITSNMTKADLSLCLRWLRQIILSHIKRQSLLRRK